MVELYDILSFQNIRSFTRKAQYKNRFANYTVTERKKHYEDVFPLRTACCDLQANRPAGYGGREDEQNTLKNVQRNSGQYANLACHSIYRVKNLS
jgi:hypothetical protein